MTLPPDSFYYVLSFLFGAGLLWVIRSYIVRTDKILTQLSDTVADLKTMVAVHEQKHEQHEQQYDHLDKKIVDSPVITQMNATLHQLNQTLALLNADYDRPRRRATQ